MSSTGDSDLAGVEVITFSMVKNKIYMFITRILQDCREKRKIAHE
jgi:hypothetical protein